MAGADRGSVCGYLQGVTHYAHAVAQAVERKVGSVRFIMASDKDPYAHSRPQLEELPRFSFAAPHAPWGSQVPRLFALLFWTALLYASALALFKRLDPR